MAVRYRVLRMEPLVGAGATDRRGEAAPGAHATDAGPAMLAPMGFEGATVTREQLEGMGRVEWESDYVALLHTADNSYRLHMEPVEGVLADDLAATPPAASTSPAPTEAAGREEHEEAPTVRRASGANWPWLTWLLIAIGILIVLGLVFAVPQTIVGS